MTLSKRLFDLGLLAIFSVVLVPVLLGLVLYLLVKQGRPVFYGSVRMRDTAQDFTLWKLRSMTFDAADQGVSGGDKTARVTPVGRVLRRSRMDELPQMMNILVGDISFVGPRPPLPVYVARYPDIYRQVLKSRPGITGLASLVFAGYEERLLASCHTAAETDAAYVRRCIPRKARLDLIYQKHQSLAVDAWLVWVTAGRSFGLLPRHGRLPRRRPRLMQAPVRSMAA